ncbi:MAG: IclR family transcriptional regulator [bacterium]
MVMKKDVSEYVVQSVSNAIDVLECFMGEKTEWGVTELSQKLNLSKNNVFRLLSTLLARGYVEQNSATGSYKLGLRSFELGQAYSRNMGLLRQASAILKKLHDQTLETVYLSIYDNGEIIYISMAETTHPVRIIPMVGHRAPAYCTAIGKVQLAFKSPEEIERVIKTSKLRPLTPNSITDKKQFLDHLAQIVKDGYAIDNEEYQLDVKCVACPIRDYTNNVVAGICISGPILRMYNDRIDNELIPLLKEAAFEISHRLGYNGSGGKMA